MRAQSLGVLAALNVLIMASLIGATFFAGLFFMPPGHLWPTVFLMIACGMTGSASATMGGSIAADVVDLDALRSREARAGLLLAFWGIAQKGADAIGVALGLWILWLFDFNPNGTNDETALLGLKLAYIAVPIVFGLTSAALLWNFPLTPVRQRRIRALLERRARRVAQH